MLAKLLVATLELQLKTRVLVEEYKKFFAMREFIFGQNPDLFAFANNVVLGHGVNEFRYSRPSDRCSRTSGLCIPDEWLHGDGYLGASAPQRAMAWSTIWSIFKRDGSFHPGDKVDVLGAEQDEANFHWLISYVARLLEGRPITKCVYFFSNRGRLSRGIIEKSVGRVFGGC